MLTKDDVIQCYRFLLGREPESDAVVDRYASEVANWQQLRTLFIESPEFRSKLEDHRSPRPSKLSFAGPPMQVELDLAADRLATLFARTSAQWQHLGATEPHWSVLTSEGYYQKNFEQNRASFYSSGHQELKHFDATLARCGVAKAGLRRCVELGCGVGRVTAALATRFDSVTGLDISPAHLQVAEQYLREQGCGNVSLMHLPALEAIRRIGPFDVLYTCLVLQHNPPPVMAFLLDALLEQLNPGGVAFFQLPTYRAGYVFKLDAYLAQDNVTQMEIHFLPQGAVFELLRRRGCEVLELREDDSIGLSATAISNTFLVRKADGG